PVAASRRHGPLGQASLAPDRAPDAHDLLAEGLAAVGELVEGAADVGSEALAGGGEADAEVAVAGGLEGGQELLELCPPDLAIGAVRAVRLRRRPLARPGRIFLALVPDRHDVPRSAC